MEDANGAARAMRWHEYSAKTKDWVGIDEAKEDVVCTAKTIKFLTFNVWFSDHYQKSRTIALCRLIEEEVADFVCLQEITAQSLRLFLADDFLCKNYLCCTNVETFVRVGQRYDVAMLVRRSSGFQGTCIRQALPSIFGRCFLYNVVNLNGNKVVVGTSHLESTDLPERRKEQLDTIYKLLEDSDITYSFMMGDFNYCSTWDAEKNNLNKKITRDVWEEMGYKDEDGWTEDTEKNLMLAAKQGYKTKQVRFDRICANDLGSNHKWSSATEARVLGKDPIKKKVRKDHRRFGEKNDKVWISDHFGMTASYDLHLAEKKEEEKKEKN